MCDANVELFFLKKQIYFFLEIFIENYSSGSDRDIFIDRNKFRRKKIRSYFKGLLPSCQSNIKIRCAMQYKFCLCLRME
jgi:hypothetical protein